MPSSTRRRKARSLSFIWVQVRTGWSSPSPTCGVSPLAAAIFLTTSDGDMLSNVALLRDRRAFQRPSSARIVNEGGASGPTSPSMAVIMPSKISCGAVVGPVYTLIFAPSFSGEPEVAP